MAYPSPDPDASCPKKRSRSDSDADEWCTHWTRHPELYMPDGTMVLLANTTVFRVYPGLLAKHSDVFRGMISLSSRQPPSAETYDGCPLVRLSDDADELAFFLESTMGLHYFLVNQPTSFRCIAAVLRLATKYMVAPLRRLAIEHISRIIPTKFDAIGSEETHAKVFGDDPPHPFALVSLFRECQLTSFLPWAFYLACREGFEKLVGGTGNGGGVSHKGQPVYLSEEDRRIALLGWKRLRDDTLEIRRTTVMSCAPTCKAGACNNTLRMSWLDTAFNRVRSDALEQWKLFNLLARYDESTIGGSSSSSGQTRHLRDITPCAICVSSWLVREKQAREKVWEKLPSYFELPVWEVLLEEERHMRSSLA